MSRIRHLFGVVVLAAACATDLPCRLEEETPFGVFLLPRLEPLQLGLERLILPLESSVLLCYLEQHMAHRVERGPHVVSVMHEALVKLS
jgi:hypothetical protein